MRVDVAVCVITYNHVKFINECLDSVLSQKLDYEWKVIIADDFSTDGTREIIIKYKEQYPERIDLILQEKNVGAAQNWIDLLSKPKTKYIAYIEGDDYWINSNKLKKQLDFMEENPLFSACFHNVCTINEKQEENIFGSYQKDVFDTADVIKSWFIPSCSILFRNYSQLISFITHFKEAKSGDVLLTIFLANKGNIKLIDGILGVYRIHGGGISSAQNLVKWRLNGIKVFVELNNHYNGEYREFFFDRISTEYGKIALELSRKKDITFLKYLLLSSSFARKLKIFFKDFFLKSFKSFFNI